MYPSSSHIQSPPSVAHRDTRRPDDSPLPTPRAVPGDINQEASRPQATPVQNPQRPSYSSSSTLNNGGSNGDIGPFAKKFKARVENERHDEKYSLSSYQHPADIPSPRPAYDAKSVARPKQPNKVGFATETDEKNFDTEAQAPIAKNEEDGLGAGGEPDYCEIDDRDGRRKGYLSNLIEFYGVPLGAEGIPISRSQAYEAAGISDGRKPLGRQNSDGSNSDDYSESLDPDDPRVTKIKKLCLDDYEDERRNVLRKMDYRSRRKEQQKNRIEFNLSCEFC